MLTIAGKTFSNRLILGTGKYKDFETMRRCYEVSGVEMVTVAVRRIDLNATGEASLLNWIPKHIALLPNTAACYTADEAVRTARLGREAGLSDWVKLEVIGDPRTLFPDTEELLKATQICVKEGFVVLPYTNDDPIMAKKLADAGAAAVMPLAAPIGSGLGVQNPYTLEIIREVLAPYGIPMIVDAGVGTASDASIAMELGADGVLLNTAVAEAGDPLKMAQAMDLAVRAGRLAFESGRMPKRLYASASSPLVGVIGK